MKKASRVASSVVMAIALVALVSVLFAMIGPAGAQSGAPQGGAPPVVSYQGHVTVGSSPYSGTGYFKFAIVNQAGDTTYWSNDGSSTTGDEPTYAVQLAVSSGLFNVLLGDTSLTNMTALDANVFTGTDRYLRVWFSSDDSTYTLLSPDRRIAAVPYALQAEEANNADTVDGYHASDLLGGGAWLLTGNSGTTPGTHFLGTTDAASLTQAVSGTAALRLVPDATSPNVIGGFSDNSVTAGVLGATIGGGGLSGEENRVTDNFGTVAGGRNNQAGDGAGTTDDRSRATVGGGVANTASGESATVAGGAHNTASPDYVTIAGGRTNVITSTTAYAAIGGGRGNVITATARYATIPGGQNNRAEGAHSFAAGYRAQALHPGAFVWADSTAADFASTAADQFLVRASGGVTLTITGGALRLEPHATSPNIIGGFGGNSVTAGVKGASIGGGGESGLENRVTDNYGTVAGGRNNQAGDGAGTTDDSSRATVGGGVANTASGESATVAGGAHNTASADYVTIAGGRTNVITGTTAHATIGGGRGNVITGTASYATIPGGQSNLAEGAYSFAAGYRAQALHPGAFVWADSTEADFASTAADQFLVRASGGVTLTVTGGALRLEPHATSPNIIGGFGGNSVTAGVLGASIGGGGLSGEENRVTDNFGTVAGGRDNQAGDGAGTIGNAGRATVGGGYQNTASAPDSTVGGGYGNTASGDYATVGGGYGNTASGDESTVGGGYSNTSSDEDATVGGGSDNTASAPDATVGGGLSNTASARFATVAGGRDNTAGHYFATVGGGQDNTASGYWSAVGGGDTNTASADAATVGGGQGNTASADAATVGGGQGNTASANYATVGGGLDNTTSASWATIAGGRTNVITGTAGSATIGGGRGNVITSTANFATIPGGQNNRAEGAHSFAAGYRAQALNSGAFVWGDHTDHRITSSGDNQFIVQANGGFWFGKTTGDTTPTISHLIDTSSGAYLTNGGAWTDSSDRDLKENFRPVNAQEVLALLAELPLTTWNYKAEPAANRHLGPTAQDFHAAFGLGADDKHIASLDSSGVALAAIQGLVQQNEALQAEIDDLTARLEALEKAQGGAAPARAENAQAPAPLPGGLLPGAGVLLLAGASVWGLQRKKRVQP